MGNRSNIKVSNETFSKLSERKPGGQTWDEYLQALTETADLHCPKCGESAHNAYALLGHIHTTHRILNDDELPANF